jgi:ubiquinone/menaquinone biosynthesis C-methylase UbiE
MSFPHHDRHWTDAAEFLSARASVDDRILAPDLFWWQFPRIFRYVNTWADSDVNYDWVVVHKGELAQLPQAFLASLADNYRPVFANEVFVIFGSTADAQPVHADSDHLRSFYERLAALPDDSSRPRGLIAAGPILPDPGLITKFAALSDAEFKSAMDSYWRNGGYKYETLRDQAYYRELDRLIGAFVGDGAGKNILDLCCGRGRLAEILSPTARVIGVDISDAAIEIASADHRDYPNFTFRQMDVHRLDFADAEFDIVLFLDSIEHLKDALGALQEATRVLKPQGRLLLTVANRDSVHQVITRKLGYPEFVTNFQHIREFSYAESYKMLAACSLRVIATAGLQLYPYWGVPGIDQVVRPLTDSDPEIVELFRILGERVGAEYAYTSVFWAEKAASN